MITVKVRISYLGRIRDREGHTGHFWSAGKILFIDLGEPHKCLLYHYLLNCIYILWAFFMYSLIIKHFKVKKNSHFVTDS